MIEYEDLKDINFYDLDEITVIKDSVKFHFHLKINKKHNSFVVFSNGAIDRQTKQPPIFQRVSWKDDIQANSIFIDDPTIHDGEMSLGWGIGREKHYYLKSISDILKSIFKTLDIAENNITFFGSSAGGTMSMILASMHKGTRAVVNNPQTRVEKFYTGNHLRKIINAFFPHYTESEFIEEFKSRISVVEAFKENGHCPEVVYILNRKSHFDVNIDYKLFIEDMENNNLSMNSVNYLIYNNELKGHNPISKENTVSIINNYANDKNLWIL